VPGEAPGSISRCVSEITPSCYPVDALADTDLARWRPSAVTLGATSQRTGT
jgi:hypothetical protein